MFFLPQWYHSPLNKDHLTDFLSNSYHMELIFNSVFFIMNMDYFCSSFLDRTQNKDLTTLNLSQHAECNSISCKGSQHSANIYQFTIILPGLGSGYVSKKKDTVSALMEFRLICKTIRKQLHDSCIYSWNKYKG